MREDGKRSVSEKAKRLMAGMENRL